MIELDQRSASHQDQGLGLRIPGQTAGVGEAERAQVEGGQGEALEVHGEELIVVGVGDLQLLAVEVDRLAVAHPEGVGREARDEGSVGPQAIHAVRAHVEQEEVTLRAHGEPARRDAPHGQGEGLSVQAARVHDEEPILGRVGDAEVHAVECDRLGVQAAIGRRAEGPEQGPVADGDPLNQVVGGVGDVEVAAGAEGHARGCAEASGEREAGHFEAAGGHLEHSILAGVRDLEVHPVEGDRLRGVAAEVPRREAPQQLAAAGQVVHQAVGVGDVGVPARPEAEPCYEANSSRRREPGDGQAPGSGAEDQILSGVGDLEVRPVEGDRLGREAAEVLEREVPSQLLAAAREHADPIPVPALQAIEVASRPKAKPPQAPRDGVVIDLQPAALHEEEAVLRRVAGDEAPVGEGDPLRVVAAVGAGVEGGLERSTGVVGAHGAVGVEDEEVSLIVERDPHWVGSGREGRDRDPAGRGGEDPVFARVRHANLQAVVGDGFRREGAERRRREGADERSREAHLQHLVRARVAQEEARSRGRHVEAGGVARAQSQGREARQDAPAGGVQLMDLVAEAIAEEPAPLHHGQARAGSRQRDAAQEGPAACLVAVDP